MIITVQWHFTLCLLVCRYRTNGLEEITDTIFRIFHVLQVIEQTGYTVGEDQTDGWIRRQPWPIYPSSVTFVEYTEDEGSKLPRSSGTLMAVLNYPTAYPKRLKSTFIS